MFSWYALTLLWAPPFVPGARKFSPHSFVGNVLFTASYQFWINSSLLLNCAPYKLFTANHQGLSVVCNVFVTSYLWFIRWVPLCNFLQPLLAAKYQALSLLCYVFVRSQLWIDWWLPLNNVSLRDTFSQHSGSVMTAACSSSLMTPWWSTLFHVLHIYLVNLFTYAIWSSSAVGVYVYELLLTSLPASFSSFVLSMNNGSLLLGYVFYPLLTNTKYLVLLLVSHFRPSTELMFPRECSVPSFIITTTTHMLTRLPLNFLHVFLLELRGARGQIAELAQSTDAATSVHAVERTGNWTEWR